jgi:hypothetical protein
MTFLLTRFHVPISYGSLVIIIKLKTKYGLHADLIFSFCILRKKNYLNKTCTLF